MSFHIDSLILSLAMRPRGDIFAPPTRREEQMREHARQLQAARKSR